MSGFWKEYAGSEEITKIVDLALEEDAGGGDVTSEAVFEPDHLSEAMVFTRDRGVIAGFPLFELVYKRISGLVSCRPLVDEGETVEPGMKIIRLGGPTVDLLKGERTALNFLQRLSGIATRTRRFVDRVAGTGILILDTRKTTPGLRLVEKYAVRVGGGRNHRMSLSDMYLVKENHIAAAGGMAAVLRRVTGRRTDGRKVEVEVKNLAELEEVLGFGVDRVMLDNFSPHDVRRAVGLVEDRAVKRKRPEIEISGGISEENIGDYCIEGVNFISIGALTHSVRSLDLSMVLGCEDEK